MSDRSAYAQVAPLHRLARRQAGPRLRPLEVDDVADVVALPTALARVRRRHERDGQLPEPATEVVVDLYEPDAGRVPITVAAESFGWVYGTELDVRADGARIVVTRVVAGTPPRGQVKKVVKGQRLSIPAGLREKVGLHVASSYAVVTDLVRRQVIVVDPRRLAAFVIEPRPHVED